MAFWIKIVLLSFLVVVILLFDLQPITFCSSQDGYASKFPPLYLLVLIYGLLGNHMTKLVRDFYQLKAKEHSQTTWSVHGIRGHLWELHTRFIYIAFDRDGGFREDIFYYCFTILSSGLLPESQTLLIYESGHWKSEYWDPFISAT